MCPKRAFRAHDVPATSGLMREPSGPVGVIATQARARDGRIWCSEGGWRRSRATGRLPDSKSISLPLQVLRCAQQGGLDRIGRFALLSGQHVGVNLQREGYRRVPEPL